MCRLVLFGLLAAALSLSTPSLATPAEKAGLYTSPLEFDYLSWDIDAFLVKGMQTGVRASQNLSPQEQHDLVVDSIQKSYELEWLNAKIQQIYANPNIEDPAQFAHDDLLRQQTLQHELDHLAPMAESILEGQVTEVLVEEEIARSGTAIPPLLFHTTPLPKALIISPRDEIKQDANILLLADLTLEQIDQLEQNVEKSTGESVLVVDVGGIGIYPTMVMRSSNLPWIIDTIAHEWTHNYLTIRPLGLNYDKTPELRTMNETTATMVGEEISLKVLERYYPEYAPQPVEEQNQEQQQDQSETAAPPVEEEPVFDFRAEMHTTRVHVDELLAAGKIEEAEAYMEERRILFVNQGYDIRKLNQAYFAFHGAYAASPGGAAGEDPVGPAVRELRAGSDSLAAFLRTISKMNSYEDLVTYTSPDK